MGHFNSGKLKWRHFIQAQQTLLRLCNTLAKRLWILWILFRYFLNTYWILFESFSGCAIALRRDFEYWGLDELLIEPCCALKYYPALEVKEKEHMRWLNPERLRRRSLFWQNKKLYIKPGVSFPNWGRQRWIRSR